MRWKDGSLLAGIGAMPIRGGGYCYGLGFAFSSRYLPGARLATPYIDPSRAPSELPSLALVSSSISTIP